MWLIPTKDEAGQKVDREKMAKQLKAAVEKSRFVVHDWDLMKYRDWTPGLKVMNVRLRKKKDYCGQHPGPCLALGPQRHRKGTWLEGADWVGFNNLINDLFDRLGYSVNVFSFNREGHSGKYYIRRGLLRRVRYDMQTHYNYGRQFSLWREAVDTDFRNCCGEKPPEALFPDDTPGIPVYTLKEEAKWLREFEHVHAD